MTSPWQNVFIDVDVNDVFEALDGAEVALVDGREHGLGADLSLTLQRKVPPQQREDFLILVNRSSFSDYCAKLLSFSRSTGFSNKEC